MIRIIAKLFVAVVFATLLHIAPLFAAAPVVWISSTGNDANSCTATAPCAGFLQAIVQLSAGGQINCINSPGVTEGGVGFSTSATIDCAGVYENLGNGFQMEGTNQVLKIRNLTISGILGGVNAIKVTGSGTLILENCVLENMVGTALDIEPTGAFNLVIKNSRISNNATGVLIKSGSGGSINATLDHVTIAGNNGGGIRADSSNGPITMDITDSLIADNVSNGLNISSGTGTQNDIVNIIRTTIAKNGLFGIYTGGFTAAVLLNASTLDSNGNGATLASNSGRIISYGNNQIIGTPGSGFTGSASFQ
jgi:hypothetical protein